MSNLQVGTFVLNAELLIYLAAGAFGAFATRAWLRLQAMPERELTAGVAWNAAIGWIAVWKGSLLLFDPAGVLDNPMTLVFFSGGTKGFWLACAAAFGYMAIRLGRKLGPVYAAKATGVFAAGWVAAESLAKLALTDAEANVLLFFRLGAAVVALAVLLSPTPRRALQALGVALLATMVAYAAFGADDGKTARAKELAPDFKLTDLDGNEVRLSDYRGRTVLVNFWATWCQVCKAEMPHVEKLYGKYGSDGDVAILSVNATSQESGVGRVSAYVERHGLSFSVVLDPQGDTLRQYGVSAYPTTYVIDADGRIGERFLGALSFEEMDKALARAANRIR